VTKNLGQGVSGFTLYSAAIDFSSYEDNEAGAECVRRKGAKKMLSETIEAEMGLPLPRPGSTGDELMKMALMYSTGQGGAPLDYVSAHMLFNLAAMRGCAEARSYRRELSMEMDRDSVAEAQRAARRWLAAS
jgi:TPR repeat protein